MDDRAKVKLTAAPSTKRSASAEPTNIALVHPVWQNNTKRGVHWQIHQGDTASVLLTMPSDNFNCCITSPPYYWQRDYGVEGQLGKEPTIAGYVGSIVAAMEQVRRVLRPDGVLFLNLGDTYYSAKGQPKGDDPKNRARRFGLRAVDTSGLGVPRKTAIGIPWRVAIEMVSRGWVLRSPVVWQRAKSIPEPTAHDRPWRTYETVFIFSKSQRYWFNRSGLKGEEDIWSISDRPKSTKGVHSAAFPDALVQRCLDVGCPPKGKVLDPFAGSGTVLRVALGRGSPSVGIELSPNYCEYAASELRAL